MLYPNGVGFQSYLILQLDSIVEHFHVQESVNVRLDKRNAGHFTVKNNPKSFKIISLLDIPDNCS